MLKFLKYVLEFFKKSTQKDEVSASDSIKPTPPLPEVPSKADVQNFPSNSNIKKIAIIVGHGNGDSGAESWDKKRNEFEYNSIVARAIEECKIEGKQTKVFWRGKSGISGVASEVVDWNPDLSIELHLNSYNGIAKGCEVLVLEGDTKSGVIARSFAKSFCGKFSRILRRDAGVNWLSSGERGAASLKGTSKIEYSILVEPFFIDNSLEWVAPEIYTKFLIEWIKSI